jgi:hypothetical protein
MRTRSRALRSLPLALITSALLAACGGGDDDSSSSNNNNGNNTRPTEASTAQGHAADATTMPLAASTASDASTSALKRALAASPSSGSAAASSAACPLGGTIAWTVEGGDAASRGNGTLDSGETFRVTFSNCKTPSSELNGSATYAVASRSGDNLDLTVTYDALSCTNWQGRFVLTGSARHQRSSSASGANTTITSRDTTSSLKLTSSIGARQASYELRNTDWTSTRTYNCIGLVVSTSHQGTLTLVTQTPRRPDSVLTVTADGMSESAGFVASGKLTVSNERDTWTLQYEPAFVSFVLDLGKNGSIDVQWTIDLRQFYGDAG